MPERQYRQEQGECLYYSFWQFSRLWRRAKVDAIIQGDRYNLVRNDNYWGSEKGIFEKVVIRYYADASTMYIDYETNALDIIAIPLVTDVKRVINGDIDNTICDLYTTMQTVTLTFNEEKNPLLHNEDLKKAVSLAIDPTIMAMHAYEFLALPAISTMPRGVKDAYLRETPRAVEAAKQALSDAGYAPSQVKLILGTNTVGTSMALAEVLQGQLAEVGIEIEILAVDPTSHIVNARNEGSDTYDLQMGIFNFATLDTANLIGTISHACGSKTFSAAADPNVDELSLKAKAAMNQEEKSALIIKIQEYLADHYWVYPLAESKTAIIYRDYLTGVRAIAPRGPNINAVTIAG